MTVLQGLGASYSNFLPDANLMVRNSGQAAIVSANFSGAAFDLKRLAAYWTSNEVSLAALLMFAVKIETITVGGPTYTFTLEIDDNSSFTSPTTVDSLAVSQTTSDFHLSLSRDYLLKLDSAAAYVRLKMTSAPVAETGSVTWSSVADNGDTITVSDGTHTVVFTFAASGNGAVGAAVNVATGGTATTSAQNFKTALNANTTLVGMTAAGAATAITITHAGAANTGGSITKSDGDNDFTVVNFSGGIESSIAFWSFIRGDHASQP